MTQKPKNTVVPLDITFSPGIDLLDQEEKDVGPILILTSLIPIPVSILYPH